jgi:hypothetical protein
MAGLVPAIPIMSAQYFLSEIAGTSPAMTKDDWMDAQIKPTDDARRKVKRTAPN